MTYALGGGALAPLNYLFVALTLAAFGVEAWAFVDAIIRPSQAYLAAGKQTKPIWLIILGVAFVLGLFFATTALTTMSGVSIGNLFTVIAFVAAAIYLADVRPKVRDFRKRGTRSGPYGPW